MTRGRVIAAAILLLAAALVWTQREPLLAAAGRFVVSTDEPVAADAIVVLAGSVPDRILEAVDLFREGWAPRIVLTKEAGMPGLDELRRRGVEVPERHDLNLTIALQLGVPREAIVLLDAPANSTVSEADVVLDHLRASGARRALIVTSKMHSFRAGLIYRDRAGPGLEIVAVAARHDPYRGDGWWRSRGYVRRLVFEYQKLAVWWLRDRWLGAEAHRPQPGPQPGRTAAGAAAGTG